jgi:hypothetical protein
VGGSKLGGVLAGDDGEGWIEFNTDDTPEGILAGDQQTAAFAGTDIDEGVAGDWVGRDGLAPVGDELAEDGWGDSIVCGDVLIVGMAGEEVVGGDEAAGVDAVHLVEGMDGEWG